VQGQIAHQLLEGHARRALLEHAALDLGADLPRRDRHERRERHAPPRRRAAAGADERELEAGPQERCAGRCVHRQGLRRGQPVGRGARAERQLELDHADDAFEAAAEIFPSESGKDARLGVRPGLEGCVRLEQVERVLADYIEARGTIDGAPEAGRRRLRAVSTAAARLPDDVEARKASAYSLLTLITDAGRRGEFDDALAGASLKISTT
jgi:hypothetical protein